MHDSPHPSKTIISSKRILELLHVDLLGAESHTYRIYDKASWDIIESCSVVFEENDGSQVAQFHVSDVDDVILKKP